MAESVSDAVIIWRRRSQQQADNDFDGAAQSFIWQPLYDTTFVALFGLLTIALRALAASAASCAARRASW